MEVKLLGRTSVTVGLSASSITGKKGRTFRLEKIGIYSKKMKPVEGTQFSVRLT